MRLKERFQNFFGRNEEIIGGKVSTFKFEGQKIDINRVDVIVTQDNEEQKREISFDIFANGALIGIIKYTDNEYKIDSFWYDKDVENEDRKYLEAAKKHLEENFEFVKSPEYQTLAIRKKVKEAIEDYLFKFEIGGREYFVEKISADSYQNIDRIYFISDKSGIVLAKIKFQDAKLQSFDCPENLENPHILEESLKFLKDQQKNLDFPDLFLEKGVKQ